MVEYVNQNGETKEYEVVNDTDPRVNAPSLVDHPFYYNRKNAIECIDEMEMIFGPEMVMHFCLGNMFKYRYRAGLKDNGYQDLEKSDWYMQKYKKLKEKIEQNNQSFTIRDKGISIVPCNTN